MTKRWVVFAAMTGFLALGVAVLGEEKLPIKKRGVSIFSLPEDQVVLTNGTALFVVVAEPSDLVNPNPLTFQWQKNGSNIFGATGPSYVNTNVQVSDVGFYTCLVGLENKKPVKVGSVDCYAPGARLFVITGTNTAVSGPFQPGTGTKSCVASYNGWVTFKNASGSTWWTPPPGSTNATIADTSRNNYNPPYVPVVQWVDNYLNSNCATNQVTFAVIATRKYQFTTYIKSPIPPPASGNTLTLDIAWSP